ncbi:DUF7673 family protein [Nitrincola iocasae]|uniref:DUF7673 domain-containing protein n=1 Tax=Nitrincola iocasae TaxID=2614693 RepID=A0A5J6LDB9_9GAMM|nr:hypothetical protein [Nitrincola iocasae]QEW06328.1 hypothetical protein F5I99_07320 [Nitrincola iocasae]
MTNAYTQEQLEQRYREAIEVLLPIAMKDTSGGRAAAQVLLSTYNAYQFHLNPLDLGLLDPQSLFNAAFDVLQLRIMLSIEPHEMIENGDDRFLQVWQRWEQLRIQNRYKEAVTNAGISGTLRAERS